MRGKNGIKEKSRGRLFLNTTKKTLIPASYVRRVKLFQVAAHVRAYASKYNSLVWYEA
jgi:hypothetical protein